MEKTLHSLEVYQLARKISKQAWNIFQQLQKQNQFSIGNQMIRAADSISANIAEGYGRYHFKESINFNNYARGSAYESLDWIEKLYERNLCNKEEYLEINTDLKQCIKKLNGYNKYLRSKITN